MPYAFLDDDVAPSAPSRSKRSRTFVGRVASRASRVVDRGAIRVMEALFLSGEVGVDRDLRAELDYWRAMYDVPPGGAAEYLAPSMPPSNVEVVSRRKQKRGERLRLRYDSGYSTVDPKLDDWFRAYENNGTCDVIVWRHADASRPTVICLHAWCMGIQWLDERVFAARTLFDMGFHVVIPTLPFHGTRTPPNATFGGQLFPSPRLDRTNEAARQAIAEVRNLRQYLEMNGHEGPFGLMGISLGGYLSAVLASVWSDWAFVVPIIAPVSFADVIWRHGENRPTRAEAERAGVNLQALREIWKAHAPLNYKLALKREHALIVSATGDEIVRAAHGYTLHQHWGEPQMRWVLGSHIAQLRWVSGRRVTRRGNVDFMAEVIPFLQRYT